MQRLLTRSDSERRAASVTLANVALELWAICTLVASCCNRPVIIQPHPPPKKRLQTRKWQKRQQEKKTKLPCSLTRAKSRIVTCLGSESCLRRRTPWSHPQSLAPPSLENLPEQATPILNVPQLQFQFPGRRNISLCPRAAYGGDFLMNRMIFFFLPLPSFA